MTTLNFREVKQGPVLEHSRLRKYVLRAPQSAGLSPHCFASNLVPANAHGQTADNGHQGAWAPVTHMGHPNGILGSLPTAVICRVNSQWTKAHSLPSR